MKESFNIREFLNENKISVGIKDGMNKPLISERLDRESKERMDGLSNIKDIEAIKTASKGIFKELYDEGFSQREIVEFIADIVRNHAK